jgi:hypothetical protein
MIARAGAGNGRLQGKHWRGNGWPQGAALASPTHDQQTLASFAHACFEDRSQHPRLWLHTLSAARPPPLPDLSTATTLHRISLNQTGFCASKVEYSPCLRGAGSHTYNILSCPRAGVAPAPAPAAPLADKARMQ